MAFTHSITRRVVTSGQSLETTTTLTADGQQSVSVDVLDAETDKLVEFDVLIADLKSIFIRCTQDMTVKTNSAGTPDDTLTLLKGQAYVWHVGSYFTNLITVDVSKLYVTNASGSDGKLEIEAVYDATP